MPDDIQHPNPDPPVNSTFPPSPNHNPGSLIRPTTTAAAPSGAVPDSLSVTVRKVPPASALPPPPPLPPAVPLPPPLEPATPLPAKASEPTLPGPISADSLSEDQLRVMRKTYRVPIDKLARRRARGKHTLLIGLLLTLVVGVGVAALILTDTLSI